jgi:Ig-like domain from next to BRCA1 gene
VKARTSALILFGPALVTRPAIIALGALCLFVSLTGQAKAQYNATYAVLPVARLLAGETATLAVKVTNTGTALWNNQGKCPVVLGYHWFQGPTRLASEPQAAALPAPVNPGGSVELTATVSVPTTPGSYTLAWDLRAHCEWFTALGGTTPGRQQVEVVPKR